MFSWESCEILKSTFFTEHLHKCLNWTTKEFILQNIGGSHIKFHANIKAKGFRKKHIRRIFEKISRSSRPEVFCKKAVLTVLRNFTKFTGKLLCQSLFFNKVAGLRQRYLAQVFSCEFCEIYKNAYFSYRTRLVAASSRFFREIIWIKFQITKCI